MIGFQYYAYPVASYMPIVSCVRARTVLEKITMTDDGEHEALLPLMAWKCQGAIFSYSVLCTVIIIIERAEINCLHTLREERI